MSRFADAAAVKAAWKPGEVERLAAAAAGDPSGAAAAIADAITAAEATALSYLLARGYPDAELPQTPETTPLELRRRVADVAMYNLARTQAQVALPVERAYADALSWFRAVASSRADIGLAAAPAVDRSAPQIQANKTLRDMVFGNGGLDSW